MTQVEINALIKKRDAFLKRIAKKAKPSARDRREFCKLREEVQKVIQQQC